MKKYIFIVLLVGVWSCEDNDNQVETYTFIKTFGGSENDDAQSVQQTPDGGYVIFGSTKSYSQYVSSFWLIKINSQGQEEWNKTYNIHQYDLSAGYDVNLTDDGGFIMTGRNFYYSSDENIMSWNGIWLVKADAQGQEEWNKVIDDESTEWGESVQQTQDGGYVVFGRNVLNWEENEWDFYIVKSNSQGEKEWDNFFGGNSNDICKSGQQTQDGGYILSGYTYSYSNGNEDFWLVKTDAQGQEEWNKNFGGGTGDYGYFVQQTQDGGYIMAGRHDLPNYSEVHGWHAVCLIKTNSTGDEEWTKYYGGVDSEIAYAVQQTQDGGYIVTGYAPTENGDDVALLKTDSNGNEEWTKFYGGSQDDYGYSVKQTEDGGYIIVGETLSFGNGGKDVLVIKTDSEGNTESYIN
tara:strand:- start:23 stop:1240 length:1218 start_codon:yes stop_codon:yes gene_type:complete